MPLIKSVKNFFTFKEPKVEPEFVLAWDEPAEFDGEKNYEQTVFSEDDLPADLYLSGDFRQDVETIKSLFNLGKGHSSLDYREFRTGRSSLAVFFLPQLTDFDLFNRDLIGEIVKLNSPDFSSLLSNISTITETGTDLRTGLEELLQGNSLILAEGEKRYIIARTKKAPSRTVSEAINERTIRGPQEGFTEKLEINLGLIQKRLHTPHLRTETILVGTLSKTRCTAVWLQGITNPRLVFEVKRRIKKIKISYLTDSGMLEQLIEDNTYHPYPQTLATERPDRVAAALAEGKVAVLVDGSHLALVMPVTVPALLHAAEDYSVRSPYGIYFRLIRILAVFFLMFLPPLYVAVNLYQPEIIPTDLLFSLVAVRQRNSFPTIIEVMLMEFIFEVILETNLRAPRYMANPLSIILGLSITLVAAFTNVLNPILLLIVALTGLAAFTLPEFSVSLSFRLVRYVYILLAFLFGFIGIAFGAYLHLHLLAKQKSFGVPMLAPIGPFTKRSKDIVLMRPVTQRPDRPDFLDPLQRKRQPKVSREWKKEQEKEPLPPEGEMTDD